MVGRFLQYSGAEIIWSSGFVRFQSSQRGKHTIIRDGDREYTAFVTDSDLVCLTGGVNTDLN